MAPLTLASSVASTSGEVTPALDGEDDGQLVRRLRDGDMAAGDALVDRHTALLLGYLRKLCRNVAIAEELHQATWVSALEHLDRFDPATVVGESNGFKAWLFRIATNKANDHFRRTGRERVRHERMANDPTVGRIGPTGPEADGRSDGLELDEEADQLRAAIEELPEPQREVVLLRYFGGLKFTEIADAVGCPLNTALGRMHKAMAKLRAALGVAE